MHNAESGLLLEECRELMTNRMRLSMSRMIGYVEDVLFEMATVDSSTNDATHYIEAVREIRMKKREIQVRFENRFISLFHDRVRQMTSISNDKKQPVYIADSSINYNHQEQNTQISIPKTVENARNECRNALSMLDQHVSTLFEGQDVKNFINPMHPETVFDAFWESCRDIRTGEDIRFILVNMFERYVVSDLHNVYDDLNTLFGYYQTQAKGEPRLGKDTQNNNINIRRGIEDKNLQINKQSVLVRNWVRSRVLRKIEKHDIPDFIRLFLLESWLMVLEDIYENYSERGPEWNRAIQVIDDLLICVKVSDERDKRMQQAWMLPGLIYRLKNGMKSIALPLKIQADFISALKAYHIKITDLTVEKKNCNSPS